MTKGQQTYTYTLKPLSFSIEVTSNSRAFLEKFGTLTRGFETASQYESPRVRYSVTVKDGKRKDNKHKYSIKRGEERIYETSHLDDLVFALEDFLLRDCFDYVKDYFLVHGAALEKGGRVIVLLGEGGSGKTTLSVGLLKRGYRFLSDEVVAIDINTLGVRAFPRALNIKNGSLPLFSSLEPELSLYSCSVSMDSEEEVSIHYAIPGAEFLAPKDVPFPVGLIIFPKYSSEGKTVLSRISRAVAGVRIMELSFNQHLLKEKGFRTVTHLVRETTCYHLWINDLGQACEMIEAMFLPNIKTAKYGANYLGEHTKDESSEEEFLTPHVEK